MVRIQVYQSTTLTHRQINIADLICPAPMTKLIFKQIRDAFAGKISIMGGIPLVALLEDLMDEAEFETFWDKFLEDIGAGDHLGLGNIRYHTASS